MVPFTGWEMPVEYSGLIAEHQAVRRAAGLFDVSHMGQFEVAGEGALGFLQRVTAGDVAKLVDGQAQYSALPLPSGCPVDDVIVYRRGPERYLIVVNAANLAKDWQWLQSQSPSGCTLADLSEAFALIALQGPRAEAILQPLTPIDLKAVAFYRFAEGQACGHDAIVARTGYTGEDGFELFVSPAAAPSVWRQLIAAGRPHGPPARRPRGPRHAAARGAHAALRERHGRDHDARRGRARLDAVVRRREGRLERPQRAARAEDERRAAPAGRLRDDRARDPAPRLPGVRRRRGVGSRDVGDFRAVPAEEHRARVSARRAREGRDRARGRDPRPPQSAARVVPTPFYKRPR